ncbi:hypothetical protein N7478_009476 [Penicillium angulare]|uniref:uncharacterized protein n=1 Tax=Penicillium angulare TaxID=116970 RepID=UPI00254205F3|nr:uncharacterized protein N7478_009476 [Penicillium angulare]KAJ5266668.1 hypothetical protein N7478_009476 [Penicillium angulare]
MDPTSNLRDDQHALAGRVTRRRWRQRFLAGVSERVAAEDTLVFMTLFGRAMFTEAVNIFRSRNLIRRNMDVLYGGWLVVGLVPVGFYTQSHGTGQIIEMPKDGIPFSSLLRVDPSLEEAAEDVFSFMGEVRGLAPEVAHVSSEVMSVSRGRACDVLKAELGGNEDHEHDASCAICREEMGCEDEVVVLECGHWFCVECITAWFGTNNDTCPMCRRKVELIDLAGNLPYLEDDVYDDANQIVIRLDLGEVRED